VTDNAAANGRSGPVGRALDDEACDVLAWPPAGRRLLQQERLASVDGERLDPHERLAGERPWLVHVPELDHRLPA
jgi:hypothetical protein